MIHYFSVAELQSIGRLNDEIATALRATIDPHAHSQLLGALLTGEAIFDAGEATLNQVDTWLAASCLALQESANTRQLPVVCIACYAEIGREVPDTCVMAACYRHRSASHLAREVA